MPYKAKKKFQTSHFVASELFFNFIYLVIIYDYFCSNPHGFNDFYGIIRFVGVTNVTGCYAPITRWLTCFKIIGFKKNMVYKIPPGWGEINYNWPAAFRPFFTYADSTLSSIRKHASMLVSCLLS